MGTHQIIRVPIAGQKPFNELIYIETIIDFDSNVPIIGTPAAVALGHMARGTIVVPSPLKLGGWDPATSPVKVPVSSTAWISGIGPQANCDFQYSVDAIRASGFDPTFPTPEFPPLNMDPGVLANLKALPYDGTYYFAIDIAYSLSAGAAENCAETGQIGTDSNGQPIMGCIAWTVPFKIKVASYLLVWETPPPPVPEGWAAAARFTRSTTSQKLSTTKPADGFKKPVGDFLLKNRLLQANQAIVRSGRATAPNVGGRYGCHDRCH